MMINHEKLQERLLKVAWVLLGIMVSITVLEAVSSWPHAWTHGTNGDTQAAVDRIGLMVSIVIGMSGALFGVHGLKCHLERGHGLYAHPQ